MVQKRFYYDEESYSNPRKHPRQVDCDNQLISFSEFVPREPGSLKIHASGESGLTVTTSEKLASELDVRSPVSARDDAEGFVPRKSLISSSDIDFDEEEEASHPQTPKYISCHPDYFIPEHPCRIVAHNDDIYSILMRNPPRKAVPIGSEYQADIPEWSPQDYKLKTELSGSAGSLQDRLMGTCVIPMPDLKCLDELEKVEIECCCLDKGSIRCVRQHIVEARDRLERVLGKQKYNELGGGSTGEHVAEHWSEEEEELFDEVVFSNPVSLGKNFWNRLADVFPCRSKMDIVSYYFNVFMLRKRAEQNRCKSGAIYDSDDDEWQASDGSEDDDSSSNGCSSTPSHDRSLDQVVQNDSSKMPESNSHWYGLSYGSSQDHDFESCNVTLWDVDYRVCPKIDVDFVSTCSLIEEVFGDGSLDYEARDDKKVS